MPLSEDYMDKTPGLITGDARKRALSTSDSDTLVMLLSLLIVAVCGVAQLVVMLPDAIGAVLNSSHASPPPAVSVQNRPNTPSESGNVRRNPPQPSGAPEQPRAKS